MAIDYQVIFPAEVIGLTAVRQSTSAGPRTLDISGKDFTSVDEVRINGEPSPSVVIVSRTRLLAVFPTSQAIQPLESLQVISRRLTLSPRSVIRFRIGNQPSKCRGLLRLMQVFLKILLTTPGRDIFAPKLGGGALKNLGRTFSRSQSGSIVSDFVLAVDTTSRQVLSLQGRDSRIPLDERLLAARVIGTKFVAEEAALVVSLEITSQAGQAAVTNIIA